MKMVRMEADEDDDHKPNASGEDQGRSRSQNYSLLPKSRSTATSKRHVPSLFSPYRCSMVETSPDMLRYYINVRVGFRIGATQALIS